MKSILRFLSNLSLILWLGGIFFFGAIMAPVVFNVMSYMNGGTEFAGLIISRAIYPLDALGIICGCVFLLASLVLHKKLLRPEHLLVVVMVVLTFASRNYITPHMESIRDDARFEQLQVSDQRKIEFERLHKWSTRTVGTIFLLGLCLVGLDARKQD